MKALLLANIGNNDLKLMNESLLPDDKPQSYFRTSRLLGEEILRDFKHYWDALEFPLIRPTLRWLIEEEEHNPLDVSLVLFASNQAADITQESERAKDTFPVAQVIKEYFGSFDWEIKREKQKARISKKNIRISEIEGSPADYRNMLQFYQKELPAIARSYTAEHTYLEVSGGTPAMTSMLILMGVEVFGPQVITLYLDRGAKQPYKIGISKALFARKTRQTLLNEIRLYAYAVGLKTLEESGDLVVSNIDERKLLAHLLTYADRRLAFDYARARQYLDRASALASGNLQARLRHWRNELVEISSQIELAELVHSAYIHLELGEYADLTQRIFRFQEAIFRHMIEKMGIQYGKGNQYLSQKWLDSQPDLQAFLREYLRQGDGTLTTDPSKTTDVDVSRGLNRYSLGAIVEFFVMHQPEWAHWRDVTETIFAFSKVADLRNRGIAGHGFEGISRNDLEAAYENDSQSLLYDLKRIYEAVFEQGLPESPYVIINQLCQEILEANA